MIVVADTTPINYLVLIDEIDLLSILFSQVLLPQAALQELQHSRTPLKIRQWITHRPAWIQVRTAGEVTNPFLLTLDPGEREAIQLALDCGIDTLLIDEAEGRQTAQALHLEVRGTLGILEQAAKLGKLDLGRAFGKLQETSFRLSPSVRVSFLQRNSEP